MRRYASKLASGAVLTLGLCLLGASGARSADDDDKKQIALAQKDVLKLAEAIEKGQGDVASQAKAIRKKYDDLNTVMAVYKPTARGGIGYGVKGLGDGIELKIIDLGSERKKVLAAAQMKAHREKLIKMGYINLAMVEVAHAYTPTKNKSGKGAKDWKASAEEMRKASKELIEAAKAGDGGKLKTAAINLKTSCNTCHSDFRDD